VDLKYKKIFLELLQKRVLSLGRLMTQLVGQSNSALRPN